MFVQLVAKWQYCLSLKYYIFLLAALYKVYKCNSVFIPKLFFVAPFAPATVINSITSKHFFSPKARLDNHLIY